jgi:hypothetical protein
MRLYKFVAKDEIEAAILDAMSSGKFKNEQDFIDHLIKNYNAESQFDFFLKTGKENADNAGKKPLTTSDTKTKRNLKYLRQRHLNDAIISQGKYKIDEYIKIENFSQFDISGFHHADLIYYWQNRILPIKFILTVLGELIITKGTVTITLKELQEAVTLAAADFQDRVESKFKDINKDFLAENKLIDTLTGFPMSVVLPPWRSGRIERKPEQVLRSRRRFLEQFLGRYAWNKSNTKRGMIGSCFEMGLFEAYVHTNDEKKRWKIENSAGMGSDRRKNIEKNQAKPSNIVIIPTNLGLDFMCMNNPVLNYIYDHAKYLPEKTFSEKERMLFMDNILPRFKLEKEIINEFFKLEIAESTQKLKEIFNKKQKVYLEKLWKKYALSKYNLKIASFSYEKEGVEKKEWKLGHLDEYFNERVKMELVTLDIEGEALDSDKLEMEINEDWARTKAHQKVHLIVLISRLAELGYCKKSSTRPMSYHFTR